MEFMFEAIIFIGIQASGKSSFFKERFADTHIRINLDMLRTRHREQLLMTACLEAKQSFVVDNTNPTVEVRAKYITAAREKKFRVVGYYFNTKLQDALERNERRRDKVSIPEIAIRGTHSRLQPPSFGEGFDKLYWVHINEENKFVVEEWKDMRL
jgi:predicted kinase